MSIKDNLIEEFESQLEEVNKMEVGTSQYKIAVDGVTKLADKIIEIEKMERDAEFKEESLVKEIDYKNRQLNEEKNDRFIKNCIAVGVPSVGLFSTWLAFIASMNFEKNGHIFSTEGGKSALRALLKFKK